MHRGDKTRLTSFLVPKAFYGVDEFLAEKLEPAIRLTDLVVGCGVHRLGNEWDV